MSDTQNESSFEQLLAEIGTLQKAMPPVMTEQNDDDEDNDPAKKGNPEYADGDADDKKTAMMAKSFVLKDAEGNDIEAFDGTELLKSLQAGFEAQKSDTANAFTGVLNLVKAQSAALASTQALVKSLQAQVAQLGGQSAGRKTVLSVHEQINTMAKSMGAAGEVNNASSGDQGMTAQDFFAKANALFDKGDLSGRELATIDVALRNGQPLAKSLDAALIQRVVSSK